MNKYIIFPAIIIFLGLLSLSSCYKDQGNYTYSEPNKVLFEGINEAYNILQSDTLRITPILHFTKDQSEDTSNYAYEWVAIQMTGAPLDSISYRKVLSKSRNLKILAGLQPETYNVYYRVTDKKTGIQWSAPSFSLTVVTSITEGYLLLCDVGGKSRLDMLSYYATDKSFHQITDVLSVTGSHLPPQGKPYEVFCYNKTTAVKPPPIYGIYILSETGTNRIHQETFDYLPSYNIRYDMVGQVAADFKADYFEGTSRIAWMVAEGNAYYYNLASSLTMGIPTNTISTTTGTENFKVAPLFTQFNGDAIFYDITNKRFVKQSSAKTNMTAMVNPSSNQLFDFKTGKDLVYITFSAAGYASSPNLVYAVMKDPSSDKYYLYRFSTTGSQDYYAEMVNLNITKATQFAVCPETPTYIFYNEGSVLYRYDLSTKTRKLMKDYGSKQISLIKFQFFTGRLNAAKAQTYGIWADKLMVCTYDPADAVGTTGSLDFFTVPTNQDILIPYSSYTGFGKVVSIAYRER